MPWYFHAESDCVFETPHPLAMESFDAALCEEIDEAKARELQARFTRGAPMDIEGTAVRIEIGDNSQPPAEQAAASSLVSDDRLVNIYLKIREAKGAFVKAHEAELVERFESPMKMVQIELKRRLQGRENKGLKTDHGTVYLHESLKVSLADGAAFVSWGKQHDCLEHFYEQRIKAGEVKNYMEEHNGEVPPGLNVFRETEARVRKPTKRGEAALGGEPVAP